MLAHRVRKLLLLQQGGGSDTSVAHAIEQMRPRLHGGKRPGR